MAPAAPARFGSRTPLEEVTNMQRPLLWKIAMIVLVALLLQIPVDMVRGLVAERKHARDGVIADIARGTRPSSAR